MVGKATEVWDNYWKRGELHSCIAASGDKNQKEVNDFWRGIFAGFDDDTVMLDIGTGNGLLPSLAVAYANDQDYGWEIHGVDLADINPARDVPDHRERLEQINFQGRIAAEELPFADNYFDLVTSQYAIEYSDMARSVPEAVRVLKPGGIFCAVLHSHHSLVVRQNRDNAREAEYMLDSDIFSRSKQILGEILSGGDHNSGIIDSYIENLRQLSEGYDGELNIIPVMQNSLMEILKLSGKYAPVQLLEMIDNAEMRLAAQRDILLNLVGSALDEAGVRHLASGLEALGLDIGDQQDFRVGKNRTVIGYHIQAQK